MSRTIHHRKPGAPRTPGKGYIKTGRATTQLRVAMALGDSTLDISESMAMRRTR